MGDGGNVNSGSSIMERHEVLDNFQNKLNVHESAAPIIASYNDNILPLLDAVDRLRNMKIVQQGIQLPTIVVVGDQSHGKSSVLESLAGISLPRGQGICTRVPLIMRLQTHSTTKPELTLEYNGKVVPTDEASIGNAVVKATEELAGHGKGISSSPLTLVVKKLGVPNLTMVDLPGITRVAVHGQPEDIYEKISEIIMKFIQPEESIILNVLSAGVDFTTCESIRMSQRVDKTGQRTLAVVTKADKAPEGLLEKINADDVSIGLGYVCVRNRIGDESYEEARAEEEKLFKEHPLLSRISKSMVGIPVLSEKLMRIQASIIAKCFPEIVRRINEKLSANVEILNKMPRSLTSVPEAMCTFMQILASARESLKKILLTGEFDEFHDSNDMHCTARLKEMLDKYYNNLKDSSTQEDMKTDFLLDEMKILTETRTIGLPQFLPKSAFLTLLQNKVKLISVIPFDFVESTWSYLENVVITVLLKKCDHYPQLMSCSRRAVQNLITNMKKKSKEWVADMVEMERLTDYTCNKEYETMWTKLMSNEPTFMAALDDHSKPTKLQIEGLGEVDISHLRGCAANAKEAFDLKMRMVAYWDVVEMRLVDHMALHLLFTIHNMVNGELDKEVMAEVVGPQGMGLERILDEAPHLGEERKRLNISIKMLKDAKDVVTQTMDKIAM